MLKKFITIFCLMLITFSIMADSNNISIGDCAIANDSFIREHISEKVSDASNDISYSLHKLNTEKGIELVKNDGATFIIVNDIEFLNNPENSELMAILYHRAVVGVIVNKANKVNSISLNDLKDILAEKYITWDNVGGSKFSIHRFGIEKGSSIYAVAENLLTNNKTKTSDKLLYYGFRHGSDVAVMVESNENAIGFIELKKDDFYLNKVKLLQIKNSNSKDLSLPYYLVFKKSNEKLAKEFLK